MLRENGQLKDKNKMKNDKLVIIQDLDLEYKQFGS